MSIFDTWIDNIALRMANILTDRGKDVIATREFRKGNQPRQLRVRADKGQFDDNLIINFTGLVEDRTVSQMFGTGIKLDFEGDEKVKTPQEEWVLGLLNANHQEKLWYNAKQYAGDAGTGYFKIVEKGITGEDNIVYPRIIPVDPAFVTIQTDREDVDRVTAYIIEYVIKDGNKEMVRKQTTTLQGEGRWLVTDEISKNGGKQFENFTEPVTLDYCPMVHWQNLPKAGSQEGEPDIKETDKELQNRLNFTTSNISKIIRLYAHPMRYVIGGTVGKNPDASPDSLLNITGEGASVGQFEPLGDLNAAMAFLKFLKQCYFDITRTVDIDSLEDKLGALTNFALKVIYQDNESKINTMRAMMGEAIKTTIMRCQRVAGLQPLPCEIVWPDFIPVNNKEISENIRADVKDGLLDKETAISEEGRDPQKIKERLDAEGQANAQNETNVGGLALQNWMKNLGV
jgi:hypothetical protein